MDEIFVNDPRLMEDFDFEEHYKEFAPSMKRLIRKGYPKEGEQCDDCGKPLTTKNIGTKHGVRKLCLNCKYHRDIKAQILAYQGIASGLISKKKNLIDLMSMIHFVEGLSQKEDTFAEGFYKDCKYNHLMGMFYIQMICRNNNLDSFHDKIHRLFSNRFKEDTIQDKEFRGKK